MSGTEYNSIGLDPYLNSLNSLGNINNQDLKEYIDGQIANIHRPGGMDYYQTGIGRNYQAVVGMNSSQGVFTDIQTALDFVKTLDGGNILVLPGTYVPGTNLTIYDNTHIEGLSAQPNPNVTKRSMISFGSTNNGIIVESSSVSVSKLSIENSTGTALSFARTSIGAVYSSLIDDCFFRGNWQDIYVGQIGEDLTIQRCVFGYAGTGGGTAIGVSNVDYRNVVILNNSFSWTLAGKGLVAINNSQHVVFSNNFMPSDVAGTPIITLGTSDYCIFTGNRIGIQNMGTGVDGIKLINSNNNVITGNVIDLGNPTGTVTAYAVNISDATSGSNVVVGNYLKAETAQTNNQGTGNVIANNS